MSRLAATFKTDARVQFRNGFYFATAFVVVFSILLLRWLPAEAALLILPVVILENVLVNTFYFMSGLLLLERVEGTFVAQSVTPLRDDEYLASKLGTLSVLSLVESLLIAVAVFGIDTWLIAMAVGVVLAAVLFSHYWSMKVFWLFDAGAREAALVHAVVGLGWQGLVLALLARRFSRIVRQ
jgi:fluoroquinolone transport system permease protein